MGTPGNERGRAYIVAQLRALGLEPEFQIIEVANYFSISGESVELVNVLARIPGTAPTMAVALVGHHDTVPGTLGANDNASAVAIMLETARAILTGDGLRNDVILLFTDGEEPAPRFGSSAFVALHPWFNDIGFVVNLEALGSGGPSVVIEMNGSSEWMIDQYAQAVPYPAVFSFVTATSELIGGSNTDFATFRDAGVFGVDLAYMTGSPIYHTMADAPERVSASSVHQQGANTLSLARHIVNLDFTLAREGSRAVFFTIGHFLVVRYPSAWALPLVLLTGVVLAAAVWRHGGWLRMLRGIGVTIATTLGSAAAAVGIWMVLAGWRSAMGVTESYLYLAGFAALALGIGAALAWLTRRRIGTGPDALSAVAVWWMLGLLATLTAPGMSYLFVWPALAGGLVLLWQAPQVGALWWKLGRWALVLVTALVMLVPAIDFFYQFAQPRPGNPDSQILATIAIPVMLIALTAELLRVFRVRAAN
ncbi:M28 family peptidase [Candidatus Bipolaricaulota bacterium]